MKIIILYLLGMLFLLGVFLETYSVLKFESGLWAFIFLTRLLDLYLTTRTTQIIITDQETILKYGVIFWLTKKAPHENVSRIKVRQFAFDKTLKGRINQDYIKNKTQG